MNLGSQAWMKSRRRGDGRVCVCLCNCDCELVGCKNTGSELTKWAGLGMGLVPPCLGRDSDRPVARWLGPVPGAARGDQDSKISSCSAVPRRGAGARPPPPVPGRRARPPPPGRDLHADRPRPDRSLPRYVRTLMRGWILLFPPRAGRRGLTRRPLSL
jgi:hypothetical protein